MQDLLAEIIQCPVTHGSLRPLTSDEIARLNERVQQKALFFLNGASVEEALESGWISTDGNYAYLVRQDVVMLLKSSAIVVNENATETVTLKQEKLDAQQFYEQIGWQKDGSDLFLDTVKFEETRPVAMDYIRQCHLRVNRYLPAQGKYLLDVASGPLQFPEYLTYSEHFQYRICVDLSYTALQEARRKLGNKGLYILGDITNLPLQQDKIDSAISLHTIYHVPQEEQMDAFKELHRVLKPKHQALVVYTWGNGSPLMFLACTPHKLLRLPKRIWTHLQRQFKIDTASQEPHLYFNPFSYCQFKKQSVPFNYELLPWRSVNLTFLKTYIQPWFFGRQILSWIYQLEETFPRFLGRYGQYPIIVIQK